MSGNVGLAILPSTTGHRSHPDVATYLPGPLLTIRHVLSPERNSRRQPSDKVRSACSRRTHDRTKRYDHADLVLVYIRHLHPSSFPSLVCRLPTPTISRPPLASPGQAEDDVPMPKFGVAKCEGEWYSFSLPNHCTGMRS